MFRSRFTLAAAVVLGMLGSAIVAAADQLDTEFWVTNGAVHAIARHENTLYLGGQFTEVSAATGAGAVFNIGTGATLPGYPQVVGRVYCAAADLFGGVYIGGVFTSVGGQPRANVAYIASDLSVSPWNPGTNGAVLALDVGPAFDIYMGGEFTTVGGQPRDRIAAVTPAGAVTAWNPAASGPVYALEVTGGSVYTGGDFNFIGGQIRANIAILSVATGLATAWNPGTNGAVRDVQIVPRPGPSNTLLIGGFFTTVAGVPRSNLAELNLTIPATATAWSPNPNGIVHTIQERLTTTYVGGEFTSIGGQPRNRIASVDPVSGFASAWNPNADGAVHNLSYASGHVIIGGRFANVGGQPGRWLAKIDEFTGLPAAWDSRPNEAVLALAVLPSGIFAGGDFTGLGGVVRNNLAAFDLQTHTVTPWNPNANAPVFAVQLYAVGPSVYKVYAGGLFTSIGGQTRNRIAEMDPLTGAPTAWNPDANGYVRCLVIRDTSLWASGAFTTIGGASRQRMAELERSTGLAKSFSATFNNDVGTMSFDFSNVYVGGFFTLANGLTRNRVASFSLATGALNPWNPNANAAVLSVLAASPNIYIGGDFTTIGGQPRNRIAAVDLSGVTTAWNPNANGLVRVLARSIIGVYAGGEFTTIGGQPRARIASIDRTTALPDGWNPGFTDQGVYTFLPHNDALYVGGTFRGIGTTPFAHFAAFRPTPVVACFPSPLTSPGGPSPRAIVSADFDNDGSPDLVTLSELPTPQANVLYGAGDGTFAPAEALPLSDRPMHAAVADFNADDFLDLAISQTGVTGSVRVYLNDAGSFLSSIEYPVYGRSDGIATGDLDNDGIVDLAVCLTDSAATPGKGGIFVLLGAGTNGVGDGSFTYGPKLPAEPRFVRRVLPVDMDADGILDLLYNGNSGGRNFIKMLPGLTYGCQTLSPAIPSAGEPGVAVTSGDYNGDGRPDMATLAGRAIRVYRNDEILDFGTCTFLPNPVQSITLPFSGRDMIAVDYTLDGNLDLICTLDSVETILVYAGLGDGTFTDPPSSGWGGFEVWGLAAGDFLPNGSLDLVVSQRDCGTVTVIEQPSSPLLATDLDLVTPNGGEIWPGGVVLPPSGAVTPPGTPWLLEEDFGSDAREPQFALASSPAERPRLESVQQITWTKGAGVPAVDVQVSRDGGTMWQTVGANLAGTAMSWIVTAPATLSALVRVRDSAVPSRMDASDAPFQIPTNLVGVPPGSRVATGFWLRDRHPVRGAAHFRLQAEKAGDVHVQVFDVSGRQVHELARGRFDAGAYDLVWDARGNGRGAAAGIYFVRARVGAVETTQKLVVVP